MGEGRAACRTLHCTAVLLECCNVGCNVGKPTLYHTVPHTIPHCTPHYHTVPHTTTMPYSVGKPPLCTCPREPGNREAQVGGTACTLHSIVYSVHYTLYTALYCVLCTFQNTYYPVYCLQYTVHSIQCTVHSVQCKPIVPLCAVCGCRRIRQIPSCREDHWKLPLYSTVVQ